MTITYQNPTPPKKSGNKKPIILVSIIVAVIAVAVVAVVLFTTGDNSDVPTSQSTTTAPVTETTLPATTQAEATTQKPTVESTEATTVAEPEGGWAKADISEIAKNIEINDVKISLPCTIGELKAQGFECDDTLPSPGSKIIEDKAFSKDGEICFCAMFDSYDYQKDLNDNTVTGIRILNVLLLDSVRFAEITKDTSRQDFLNSFDGNIKETSTDSNYYSYFYTIYDINNEESYLSVVFSVDDNMQGITIHI